MTDDVALHARETIAAGSKSFALASRLFEPRLRNAAAELYAWCRYCDDAIDGQELGHGQTALGQERQARILTELRARTEQALAGDPDNTPEFQGLARVVEQYGIPPHHPRELLDGFAMDVERRPYDTEEELLDYCYHVAGVVGVMMARIMGVTDADTLDRASDLGVAFQLTNIARDLVEDARVGRVYVPGSLLRRHQAPTDAAALTHPSSWPYAYRAVLELLEIADCYYSSAGVGANRLPFRCAWAIGAASKVYSAIGHKLREQGPSAWRTRVSSNKFDKLLLAAEAFPWPRQGAEIPRSKNLYQRPGI